MAEPNHEVDQLRQEVQELRVQLLKTQEMLAQISWQASQAMRADATNIHKLMDTVQGLVVSVNEINLWKQAIGAGVDPVPIDADGTAYALSMTARLLAEHYDSEELAFLAFEVGVNLDELGGQRLSTKARRLVTHTYRRGLFWRLVNTCRAQRPFAPWPVDTGQLSVLTKEEFLDEEGHDA